MIDLSQEEWHLMETKNTVNGSREFDIFNENGDLIATVYPDAGSETQALIARVIVNIPAMLEAMKLMNEAGITHANWKAFAAKDKVRKLLARIDGTEAH